MITSVLLQKASEFVRFQAHLPLRILGDRRLVKIMQRLKQRPKHRRDSADQAHTEPVGSDGLTDHERSAFMARFRAGIGSKPAPDAEWNEKVEVMADKLRESAANRRNRRSL